MHRVLVTGAAGRIGRAVVRELKARGHFVRGLDLRPTRGADESVVADVASGPPIQAAFQGVDVARSEEHTSELQSRQYLVCRLLRTLRSLVFPYTTLFRSDAQGSRHWRGRPDRQGRCPGTEGARAFCPGVGPPADSRGRRVGGR